jgi:hypothetical protein
MAFYSGNASSAQDLVDAIVAGCLLNGWTESDGVLSKGDNHFRPDVVGTHIKCEMGDAAAFVSPGIVEATAFPYISLNQTWPVFYRLFVLDGNGADTVVLSVLEANAIEYKYLMFGNLENKVGAWAGGQWMHGSYSSQIDGTTVRQSNVGSSLAFGPFADVNGGSTSEFYTEGHGPLFANMGPAPSSGSNFKSGNSYVACDIDTSTPKRNTNGLGTLAGAVDAFRFARVFLLRSPNLWNGEAVLVPAHVFLGRDSGTVARLGTVGHVRYMRMDNYEPGDVITLGLDKWMVLPMYMRNATAVLGANALYNSTSATGHTGQMAYAIKYDGP